MTRRIRFTPLLTSGVFALACLLHAPGARAADVPFAARPALPSPPVFAEAVAHADLDRDGDLDVVSGGSEVLAWHRNGGAGTAWTAGTIGTFAGPLMSVLPADVDGDGDPDVVVAFPMTRVDWYENVGGLGASWVRHTLIDAPGLDSMALADVDRDGDTDLAAHSNGGTRWYANDGAGGGWTPRTIGPGSASDALAFADLDGDGDPDAVTVTSNGTQLVWYENTAGTGLAWTLRNILTVSNLPTTAVTADVDGDGDPDVALQTTYGVFWFENRLPAPWTQRTIWTAAMPLGLALGDIDGDGDLDMTTPSGAQGVARWHENAAGNGTSWVTRGVQGLPTQGAGVALGDLDGDGDADVSAATNVGVRWYANETNHQSVCFLPPAAIASGLTQLAEVFPADIDGDGDPDLVSSSGFGGVQWHRNDRAPGPWTGTTVSAQGSRRAGAADVDRDGDLDLSNEEVELLVYDNVAGDGSAWTPRTVTAGVELPGSHAPADLDGDGDVDFLTSASNADTVSWFENADGLGTAWSRHAVGTDLFNTRLTASDIDGDGDVDAVFEAYDGGAKVIGWFENQGDGAAWTRRTISTAPYGSLLALADVDGDGDPDALVASGLAPSGVLRWLANGGQAASWLPLTPLPVSARVRSAAVTDADGDGDPDVVAAGAVDDVVRFFENTSGDGSAWAVRTVATDVEGPVVATTDLDRDGDADLVMGSSTGTLQALSNGRGQFSLAADGLSFGGVPDGSLVPMLRLDVRHLGRAGDADARLDTLSVRFEQFPHVPIPTAAMNALVSSLRVYRDTNGNDVFDPASDALLASVGPLALDDGTQAVTLPTGPDVRVAAGATKDYFVVLQMTANASHQDLASFQVTLLGLGPQASRVYQDGTDIRLTGACPANLTSNYVRAVSGVPANVSGTKQVTSVGPVPEGGEVVYTFVLSNTGAGVQLDNNGYELIDTAPSAIVFTDAESTIGLATPLADGLGWNGRLLPGQSTTITARARVKVGTAGLPVVNQGVISHDTNGDGINDPGPLTDDPTLPGSADPATFVPVAAPREGELTHGVTRTGDFTPLPGSVPDNDLYQFLPADWASYEFVVDGTAGELGPGGGPRLDRLRPDGATLLQPSAPVGTGAARSLRFEHLGSDPFTSTGHVRVESAGCEADCTDADRYRIRAYETTLAGARYNNTNGQATVLILQNATHEPIAGHALLWQDTTPQPFQLAFSLPPHGSQAINLGPNGGSGSITVTHTGTYGGLVGKTVGIDPLVGATFDTPLLPRIR